MKFIVEAPDSKLVLTQEEETHGNVELLIILKDYPLSAVEAIEQGMSSSEIFKKLISECFAVGARLAPEHYR